jgi:hypothetical protein
VGAIAQLARLEASPTTMDGWTHDEVMEILTATAVSTRYIP